MPETNADFIEIYKGEDDTWNWRAKSNNGEIVASGESDGFHTFWGARRAAEGVFPGVEHRHLQEEGG